MPKVFQKITDTGVDRGLNPCIIRVERNETQTKERNQMQINHKDYPENLKTKTDAQLHFAIKDAQQAIAAYPEGYKAGYYADEIHYCAMELKKRILKNN